MAKLSDELTSVSHLCCLFASSHGRRGYMPVGRTIGGLFHISVHLGTCVIRYLWGSVSAYPGCNVHGVYGLTADTYERCKVPRSRLFDRKRKSLTTETGILLPQRPSCGHRAFGKLTFCFGLTHGARSSPMTETSDSPF